MTEIHIGSNLADSLHTGRIFPLPYLSQILYMQLPRFLKRGFGKERRSVQAAH